MTGSGTQRAGVARAGRAASALEYSAGEIVAGRYRLERFIGQGGMGVVWAGRHVETAHAVALKMLHGRGRLHAVSRRRLLREARAVAAVQHPNVVYVHEVCEGDEGPVIVMDLLEGETLGDKLVREERLGLSETADLLVPVIAAVAAAHACGIVHRDLKPDNIFLVGAGDGGSKVRVLDFGIAKLLSKDGEAGDTASLTSTGATLGTPCYMAPEQGFGEPDIDGRADVWALGAIIYECLSGGRPIEGNNLGQVLKRLLNEGVTPLERVVPGVPADVCELVASMLRVERAERLSDLQRAHSVLAAYATGVVPKYDRRRATGTRRAVLWGTWILALAGGVAAVWGGNGSRGRAAAPPATGVPHAEAPTVAPERTDTMSTAREPRSPRRAANDGHADARPEPFAPPPATSAVVVHRAPAARRVSAGAQGAAVPSSAATVLGGLASKPPF